MNREVVESKNGDFIVIGNVKPDSMIVSENKVGYDYCPIYSDCLIPEAFPGIRDSFCLRDFGEFCEKQQFSVGGKWR